MDEVVAALRALATDKTREGMTRCFHLFDKKAPDASFEACLPLCERGAADERNFVKKGVSWALRGVGQRSRALNAAATEVAQRLVASSSRPARWVGKDALKELADPARRAKLKR